jgi:flagellar assembly protein FliH
LSRIKGHNIKLGNSFIVPIEQSSYNVKLQEALEKEKEIIFGAEKKVQEIIEQAQSQAQEIIETAKKQALSEVDKITAEAHQGGFNAGRQEGLENITQELQDKIINMNAFAKSEFEIKNNIIKSAHLDIVNLIIEIAQKVCSKSFELDDNILKEITQTAINSLKDKEHITIIVNPEMSAKIYSISDELKEKIPQLSSIKIIEDNSVSPDGTIVESALSRVDCRIKSQINEIADKLMEKLNSANNEDLS